MLQGRWWIQEEESFLSILALSTVGLDVYLLWGPPLHCRMLSSILGLSSIASPVVAIKISKHCFMSLGKTTLS